MNLIIIGSGFDKAHGLRSLYTDFVEDVIKAHLNDRQAYSDLLSVDKAVNSIDIVIKNISKYARDNMMFQQICSAIYENWCDIEQLYFDGLIRYEKPKQIENWNNYFEKIKSALFIHLQSQNSSTALKNFKFLFDKISSDGVKVLNFNYTNTAELYFKKSDIIYIHGELSNAENPPIFGYAPNDDDSNMLLNRVNDEYIKNIKEFNYDKNEFYNQLFQYLNGPYRSKIDLYIVGHSCGLSDRMILGDIFRHKSIGNVYVLYRKSFNDYLGQVANIARIAGRDFKRDHVANYSWCISCPQIGEKDRHEQIESFVSAAFSRTIATSRQVAI